MAAWSEAAMPAARVKVMDSSGGNLHTKDSELVRWLSDVGAEVDSSAGWPGHYDVWTFHPAHVIRKFTEVDDTSLFLDADWCAEPAFKTVFGGPNAEHCDNLFMVQTLLPHAPLPVDGFVLYAESKE
ncbi:hypothetical protein VZQ01_35830 [Myxococcus faecalis]|uniref:hypothetical protein n=1 Tax=Myxococcus TaxID=32 RepID=UPI0020BFA9D4|nr:hypothetical protein [Myxococcus fulvus]MCK8502932.1 hypothetical protein [Myxococcus fulvus]